MEYLKIHLTFCTLLFRTSIKRISVQGCVVQTQTQIITEAICVTWSFSEAHGAEEGRGPSLISVLWDSCKKHNMLPQDEAHSPAVTRLHVARSGRRMEMMSLELHVISSN